MKLSVILRFLVILLANFQISFSGQASEGIIFTKDGKLKFYENDKFVKQKNII